MSSYLPNKKMAMQFFNVNS